MVVVAQSVDALVPPTYNTSGITVFSGTPGASAFDGPWFVQEQSLAVDFHRVPIGSLSSFAITLSGVEVIERIEGTELIAEVNATYTSYKDWSPYYTSAWQQPQKFKIISFSGDPSYGDLTPSTLGAVGTVVTTQKFYNRRLWSDASGDSEVSKSIQGTTYYAIAQPNMVWSGTVDPTPFNDKFEFWLIPGDDRGTLQYPHWRKLGKGRYAGRYTLPGDYATASENLWRIIDWHKGMGHLVTNSLLYDIPASTTGTSVIADVGISEYRTNRHDYS